MSVVDEPELPSAEPLPVVEVLEVLDELLLVDEVDPAEPVSSGRVVTPVVKLVVEAPGLLQANPREAARARRAASMTPSLARRRAGAKSGAHRRSVRLRRRVVVTVKHSPHLLVGETSRSFFHNEASALNGPARETIGKVGTDWNSPRHGQKTQIYPDRDQASADTCRFHDVIHSHGGWSPTSWRATVLCRGRCGVAIMSVTESVQDQSASDYERADHRHEQEQRWVDERVDRHVDLVHGT